MNLALVVLLALVASFVAAAIFQVLWNTTMPEVFGLKQIRYWVAYRLLLISTFLGGGFLTVALRL